MYFTHWQLTLYIRETHERVFLQTVKTQMKCSIKLHFIRVYTVFVRQKNIVYFFKNKNMTPLDMYNGLSKFIESNQKEESINIQRVNCQFTCYINVRSKFYS